MDIQTARSLELLETFFAENPRIAIGFSGGCDSSFLLDAAARAAVDVGAYIVRSDFQASFEYEDARHLCNTLGIPLRVIHVDILSDPDVRSNPKNRCYYCKRAIFSKIAAAAEEDGYGVLCDGTNASDDISDRPGWRALQELGVRSPLREVGLQKTQIRYISGLRGLPTASRPANACLATRFPTGTVIEKSGLVRVEKAEDRLRDLGFEDFRVRLFHEAARLQFCSRDFARAIAMHIEIRNALEELFDTILIDVVPR